MRVHEDALLRYATDKIKEIDGIRIIGEAKEKASVLSFVIDRVHPQDIGILLDNKGIAVRTGHHCAEPLMNRFASPEPSVLPLQFITPWKKSISWRKD